MPSGAEVKVVKYEAPMGAAHGRTGARLGVRLAERYGAPTRASSPQAPLDLTCSAGKPCRSAHGTAQPALHAEEHVCHKVKLVLWRAATQNARGRHSYDVQPGGGRTGQIVVLRLSFA